MEEEEEEEEEEGSGGIRWRSVQCPPDPQNVDGLIAVPVALAAACSLQRVEVDRILWYLANPPCDAAIPDGEACLLSPPQKRLC